MKNKTALWIKLIMLIFIFITLLGIAMGLSFRMGSIDRYGFSFGDRWGGASTLYKTHDFNDVNEIDVDATNYSVEIEEHDKDTVVIEEYKSDRGNIRENKAYKTGDTVYFEQPGNISFFSLGSNNGRIVIKVPSGSKLVYKIDSMSGSVKTAMQSENLDIETISGSIKVHKGGEKLKAKSTSGSIKIYSSYKEAELGSTSGSVKAIADKDSEEIDAKTVSGSVKIALEGDLGYTMDYSSVSGSVSDNYSGIKYQKNGVATKGDEGLAITASTISGSIKLEDW